MVYEYTCQPLPSIANQFIFLFPPLTIRYIDFLSHVFSICMLSDGISRKIKKKPILTDFFCRDSPLPTWSLRWTFDVRLFGCPSVCLTDNLRIQMWDLLFTIREIPNCWFGCRNNNCHALTKLERSFFKHQIAVFYTFSDTLNHKHSYKVKHTKMFPPATCSIIPGGNPPCWLNRFAGLYRKRKFPNDKYVMASLQLVSLVVFSRWFRVQFSHTLDDLEGAWEVCEGKLFKRFLGKALQRSFPLSTRASFFWVYYDASHIPPTHSAGWKRISKFIFALVL